MIKVKIDFWTENCKKVFDEIKRKLIEKGFTEEESLEILETLYNAIKSEYGE